MPASTRTKGSRFRSLACRQRRLARQQVVPTCRLHGDGLTQSSRRGARQRAGIAAGLAASSERFPQTYQHRREGSAVSIYKNILWLITARVPRPCLRAHAGSCSFVWRAFARAHPWVRVGHRTAKWTRAPPAVAVAAATQCKGPRLKRGCGRPRALAPANAHQVWSRRCCAEPAARGTWGVLCVRVRSPATMP